VREIETNLDNSDHFPSFLFPQQFRNALQILFEQRLLFLSTPTTLLQFDLLTLLNELSFSVLLGLGNNFRKIVSILLEGGFDRESVGAEEGFVKVLELR